MRTEVLFQRFRHDNILTMGYRDEKGTDHQLTNAAAIKNPTAGSILVNYQSSTVPSSLTSTLGAGESFLENRESVIADGGSHDEKTGEGFTFHMSCNLQATLNPAYAQDTQIMND